MAVYNWHFGKIVILWAWGGLLVALMLTDFMGREIGAAPLTHLVEFVTVPLVLISLSVVTWIWLGGKESK